MEVGGQVFSEAIRRRIAGVVAAQPSLSRRQLARQVCGWLDWRSPDGRLQEMAARKALLTLHRRGHVPLPPARDRRPGLARDRPPPLVQTVTGALAALGQVELVWVEKAGSAAAQMWTGLMAHHHPLGAGPLCGAQVRYLIVSERHGLLGAMAFSSAAWRLAARDRFIGWDEATRRANLGSVVNQSRFLIAPSVSVPHLASHVLALAARRLPGDWQARYGIRPVLLETFVDPGRFSGTCYRAANWQKVGTTRGRGRQDRARTARLSRKAIYLYPLHRRWRPRLCGAPSQAVTQPPAAPPADWAEAELGGAVLGDRRLRRRLLTLARARYAKPTAALPQACGSRAATKAAYRFLAHPRTTMQTLLAPHIAATISRAADYPVVLAVADTTGLNYTAHPDTDGLGPIGTTSLGPTGLWLHDTMAFTPDGLPLGLVDVQVWARDPKAHGQRALREHRAVADKESQKWLTGLAAVSRAKTQAPAVTWVSVADAEADLYALFAQALGQKDGPALLIRARHNRATVPTLAPLREHLAAQPVAGIQELSVPRQGQRAARQARLAIRYAPVRLKAPKRSGAHAPPLALWVIAARELDAPADGTAALDWLLLTTLPVTSFAGACEKLSWYTRRWGIEVYHRTLKSGCRIEERQLGTAQRLTACLAIDLVVAWRILHLTYLGRAHPEVPCTAYFEEAQWQALVAFVHRDATAAQGPPPPLRTAVRLVAGLGGFLGRKGDGEPGAQTLWRGLQRLDDITLAWRAFGPNAHDPTVPSDRRYG
jgi:hypothetical protein